MSKQTGSLIFFVVLATVAGIAAYLIDNNLAAHNLKMAQNIPQPVHQTKTMPDTTVAAAPAETLPTVDTTGWKTYVSKSYPFTFKYPAKWTATPHPTNTDYDMVILTPNDEPNQITVYLSKKGFLGMDNLNGDPITVSTVTGTNVQNALVGLHYLDTYYTYDLGSSTHKAEFMAIVNSTVFLPKK
jgi:hypothetical protein